MSWSILSALGLGFALGLKHALDADHLAAVAAMIGDRKRSVLGASLVGVTWGAGHAFSLTAVGLAVITLGVRVPPGFASGMEFAVGGMLVFLGVRLLWSLKRGAVLHAHRHAHGDAEHFHLHVHAPGAEALPPTHHALPAAADRIARGVASPLRPFLVGLLHGMAGSGALMLLVLAALPSASARLAYVILFALGSIAGMGCMSALAGLPFALGGPAGGRAQRGLRLAAGTISVLLGLSMMLGFSPDL